MSHQTEKKTSRTFDIIVARAIIDNEFRDKLLNNREEAIKEYQLSEADLDAIRQLDAKSLSLARETASIVGMVCSVGSVAGETNE